MLGEWPPPNHSMFLQRVGVHAGENVIPLEKTRFAVNPCHWSARAVGFLSSADLTALCGFSQPTVGLKCWAVDFGVSAS